MAPTQVPPPPAPAQQEPAHQPDDNADAIHGHPRAQGPSFEPKWTMTMMLQDVLYLLRLRHRRSGIDF